MSSLEFIKKIISKYSKGIENYLYKTVFYSLIYILFVLFSIILNVDYQALGISLVFIFYLVPNLFLLYLLAVIFLATNTIQFYSLLSFLFIYMYNGEKGKNIKYFFYLYYPLHLLILKMLQIL